ncbi:hypothetical protein [Chitinophaga defluvii]|uniref:Uncharacterized protein n=1 Tax=Chitinophaga defluvii TaxID=3163343 RepID=A0ABV2T6M9_9BACT
MTIARKQKILFIQEQLNRLQLYGSYGYEVLEELRSRLTRDIEERLNEGIFEFCYKGKLLCAFDWKAEDIIEISVYDKGQLIVYEYSKEKMIGFEIMINIINNHIRELDGKLIMIG